MKTVQVDPSKGVQIGDLVRAHEPSMRPQVGRVVAETRNGQCWMIELPRGYTEYAKDKCQKWKSDKASKAARRIRKLFKPMGRIYGDGDC